MQSSESVNRKEDKMDHLTNEEIIDFVQAKSLDAETMQLIAKVNAHIGNCLECQEKVALFIKIQDKMDDFQRDYEYQNESLPETTPLHELKTMRKTSSDGRKKKVKKKGKT